MTLSRCLTSVVALSLVTTMGQMSAHRLQNALQDPPPPNRTPPAATCSFAGPLLRVPSKAAGGEGVLVRVSPPSRGRYPEGAPIAVHMIAARPSVSGSRACLSERGFI